MVHAAICAGYCPGQDRPRHRPAVSVYYLKRDRRREYPTRGAHQHRIERAQSSDDKRAAGSHRVSKAPDEAQQSRDQSWPAQRTHEGENSDHSVVTYVNPFRHPGPWTRARYPKAASVPCVTRSRPAAEVEFPDDVTHRFVVFDIELRECVV